MPVLTNMANCDNCTNFKLLDCNCQPRAFTDFQLFDASVGVGDVQMRVKEDISDASRQVPNCGFMAFYGKDKSGCLVQSNPEFLVIDAVVHNSQGYALVTFHRVSGTDCDLTNLGGLAYQHFDNEILSIGDGNNPYYWCNVCSSVNSICQCLVSGNGEIYPVCERCFVINPNGPPDAISDAIYQNYIRNDPFTFPAPSVAAPGGKKWVAFLQFYGAVFSSAYTGTDFDVPTRCYFSWNQNQGVLGCPNGDIELSLLYPPGSHADSDFNLSGFLDNNGLGYNPAQPVNGTMRMVYEVRQDAVLRHQLDFCWQATLRYFLI